MIPQLQANATLTSWETRATLCTKIWIPIIKSAMKKYLTVNGITKWTQLYFIAAENWTDKNCRSWCRTREGIWTACSSRQWGHPRFPQSSSHWLFPPFCGYWLSLLVPPAWSSTKLPVVPVVPTIIPFIPLYV